ncbi:oxygen tolerance protein BatD [Nonlabens dokdonensis]|uniref:Oxygen tolerance protein BatD n=2 Tax=Nonlabens dokdonensis TaxID=328515 RepID=A0ABX5Q1J4_9FLAO|nr:BatD family protein [Nonlabens dokdonensis]AGC76273.1 putative BatD-like protein [Nonlabens dokdonensis DSW-6]PZX43935.1 oxygen tolerance protein BatD [Nonlabens dokdonensis]
MKQLIYIFFFLISSLGVAQVSFTATSNKNRIDVKDTLRLEFKINQYGHDFKPPNLEKFQIINGPNKLFSQKWINGEEKVGFTYEYYVKPISKGRIVIESATIKYLEEIYETKSIKIRVSDVTDLYPTDFASRLETIKLVADVTSTNVYLNEPIVLEYKMYIHDSLSIYKDNIISEPKFPDFIVEKLTFDKKIKDDTCNEKKCRSLIIGRVVIYPKKEGELIIEPLKFDLGINFKLTKIDSLKMSEYGYVQKIVSSDSITIVVNSIPVNGKPDGFYNAIGNFNLESEISKSTVGLNDEFVVNIKLKGTGNLNQILLPELPIPSGLKLIRKESNNEVMKNHIFDKYIISSSIKGEFEIPSIKFSYFDPVQKKYFNLATEKKVILVD